MIPRAFDPTEPPAPRLVHYIGRPRGAVALPAGVAGLTAEQRLDAILATGQLRAFPAPGSDDVAIIAMSDSSPAEIEAAFRTGLNSRGPFEPWALVLDREDMWSAGARPVLYLDNAERGIVRNALEERAVGRGALVQRLDVSFYRSDWTHEREWRWIERFGRQTLPIWSYLEAVIVGRHGWQPDQLLAHPEARNVRRWWWTAGELVDDGLITEPSPYE